MFYIRTEKNKYDIDVVIDITDNQEFVETSGLFWIKIEDVQELPSVGSYYYQGKFITVNDEEYELIKDIIFEFEEVERLKREEEEKKAYELYMQQQEEELNDDQSISDELLPSGTIPIDVEEVLYELPKPVAKPLDEIESTEENYEMWKNILTNLEVTVSAYESKKYTVNDNEITFNPPIEFPDGVIHETVVLPYSMTIDDQIEYLIAHKQYVVELLERIKNDLGL